MPAVQRRNKGSILHDVFAFENSLYTTVSREGDVSASAMLNPMEPKKQWEITAVVWIRRQPTHNYDKNF